MISKTLEIWIDCYQSLKIIYLLKVIDIAYQFKFTKIPSISQEDFVMCLLDVKPPGQISDEMRAILRTGVQTNH